MLDITFQNLIRKILEIEQSHVNDTSESAMLSDSWKEIFSDHEDWVVLSVSTSQNGGYWIVSHFLPESKTEELVESLPEFNIMVSSVAYGHVASGDEHWLEPYWGDNCNFNESEIPIYFSRRYDASSRTKEDYVEFNQLVTHSLDLHWSPKRNAYCIIDDYGEEDEQIKIIDEAGVSLVLIKRKALDKILHLGRWNLIRYFVFQRLKTKYPPLSSLRHKVESYIDETTIRKFEIRKSGIDQVDFFEVRGAHIQKPISSKKILNWNSDYEKKKYGEFCVQDLKNNRLLENYSLRPSNFANYFTKSDLPYEMSPIFFDAQVLAKYKDNPDKYSIEESHIRCKGGWLLERYGINEYNQVHTYAVYLGRLPYKEQLQWQQYNEKPKGPISQQSIQTDFFAQWPTELSLMHQLRVALEKLSTVSIKQSGPIWQPKNGWNSIFARLHPVHTENLNEWHNFIIELANATIQGFQAGALKKIADAYGKHESEGQTLNLIKYILTNSGNSEHIATTHAPLVELQKQRGNGKAHGNWTRPEGSLVEDAREKLKKIISAVNKLAEIFQAL